MATRKLGKPVLGIDKLSDETSMPQTDRGYARAVRDLLNIDLDSEGNTSRRQGYTRKLATSGFHSMYTSEERGWLIVCNREEMGVYDPDTNLFTALHTMAAASMTSFTEVNGKLYGVNNTENFMFREGSVDPRPLGVPLPSLTPSFSASSTGGLRAGKYAVAYSLVDSAAEESGLGETVVVDLPDGGGIQGTLFASMPGHKYRIYMTAANGEELYEVLEFDATLGSVLIDHYKPGRKNLLHGLEPLPPGHIVRGYKARLFIATTTCVAFSDAFRHHLHNPGHNFIPTTGFVGMIEPVDSGVFISDAKGVRFYRGSDPNDFQVKNISSEPAIFGTAISVPARYLPKKFEVTSAAAIWLSRSGYHVGLPTGEVVRLHADQIRLPKYVQGCSALAIRDGRKQLVTPVHSVQDAATGLAVDSIINN